jgi:crotonobetainyl-CoA:carnitine CoA-transferase CaiB-like acyl-CoA transferase
MTNPGWSSAFLSGVSVLDFSIWRPGPYATSLLVYLGADVIKVEPPGGDPMRHYPELFAAVNAGKRSIVLDLKNASDRPRALELAAEADVVIEGFRPGVMAGLRLDEPTVRQANPAVVYCSISGYGQRGPLARLPGHDVNYQAWAGALSPDGEAATIPPLPIADLASGMTAAFGICGALFGRVSSGAGAYLDVSMTDVMATWTGDATTRTTTAPTTPTTPSTPSAPSATTTSDRSVPGYGIFLTADSAQIALGVVNEQHFWSALCDELGLGSLSGLDFSARMERNGELDAAVADAIGRRRRDELLSALVEAGVPVAPLLDRAQMVAAHLPGPFAAFPPFPIRLATTDTDADHPPPLGEVPALDAHRDQGFLHLPPRSTP